MNCETCIVVDSPENGPVTVKCPAHDIVDALAMKLTSTMPSIQELIVMNQDVENAIGGYQTPLVSEEERAMVLERRVPPRLGIHAREVKIGVVISERDAVMHQMAKALTAYVGTEHIRTHRGNDEPGYTVRIWTSDWVNGQKALAAYEQMKKESER